MQLKEVKFGHSYQHRTLGQCAIVSCHPHDGAALIVAYWDHENDEEKFVLAVPEDLLYILPDEPVMRTEGACMATPVEAQVIMDLIELARATHSAIEDSESISDGVRITEDHAIKLSDLLTVLDLLPEREGYVSTGPIKAAYALEHILALLPNVKILPDDLMVEMTATISKADLHTSILPTMRLRFPDLQRALTASVKESVGKPFRYLGSVAPRIDGEPTLTPFFDSNLAASVTATAMAHTLPLRDRSSEDILKCMQATIDTLRDLQPFGLSDVEWNLVKRYRETFGKAKGDL